uniref:Outer dense fiber of sperm tails 3-like 2a n=1 Tax=Seriola lalandi dorsalis TaxID=1841481 RepID=A0A3B4WC48_SERLL
MEIIRDTQPELKRGGCAILLLGAESVASFSSLSSSSSSSSSSFSLSGPGPGRYALPPTVGYINHDFTTPSSPRWCLKIRKEKSQPKHCFLYSTSYSLPNLLGCQVPNKPSSASYSFSGRRKVGAPSEDLSMSPGPGKYNSTNPDIYRHRQPSFSMQSRTKRPGYSSAVPGPGAYSPEKFHVHLPKPPSFTLGVRHSEFVTPLVVDVVD